MAIGPIPALALSELSRALYNSVAFLVAVRPSVRALAQAVDEAGRVGSPADRMASPEEIEEILEKAAAAYQAIDEAAEQFDIPLGIVPRLVEKAIQRRVGKAKSTETMPAPKPGAVPDAWR